MKREGEEGGRGRERRREVFELPLWRLLYVRWNLQVRTGEEEAGTEGEF